MKKLNLILMAFTLVSCSAIKADTITLPADDKQRAFTINLNTKAQGLYDAYMSKNLNQRRLAEMYVAGVLDSSEGIFWCDYSMVSPDAIQEQVFAALKSAVKHSPDLRASTVITNKFKNLLPCKEQQ